MNTSPTRLVAALLPIALIAPTAFAETYHLYFVGGQSNMAGFGAVDELPEGQDAPVPGARIYTGGVRKDHEPADGPGLWADVTPGFGAGFRTDGETNALSGRFGPELSFARRIRALRPGEKIAIIKYAKGGSSIDDRNPTYGTWDPHDTRGEGPTGGVNQYDHALSTIRNATRVQDIDGDGEPDTLIPAGILWMQGETDANHPHTAAAYDDNLRELIGLLRAAMRADDLPFVMGRISDSRLNKGEPTPQWTHGDIVRAAQAEVALTDPHAELVTSTDAYGYSDPAHYDTAGYLDLGERFAEAMDGLRDGD